MTQKTVLTTSVEETQHIAQIMARDLSLPIVITLTGNMGVGKTTFVQGLAAALGVEKKVNSPTFLLIKKYELQGKNLYHVDLYRLSSEEEIVGTGLLDIMKEKDSIVVIEWAEKMGKFLPEKRFDVQFEYIDENKRKIIVGIGNKYISKN